MVFLHGRISFRRLPCCHSENVKMEMSPPSLNDVRRRKCLSDMKLRKWSYVGHVWSMRSISNQKSKSNQNKKLKEMFREHTRDKETVYHNHVQELFHLIMSFNIMHILGKDLEAYKNACIPPTSYTTRYRHCVDLRCYRMWKVRARSFVSNRAEVDRRIRILTSQHTGRKCILCH